jgi:hypothetical protein
LTWQLKITPKSIACGDYILNGIISSRMIASGHISSTDPPLRITITASFAALLFQI